MRQAHGDGKSQHCNLPGAAGLPHPAVQDVSPVLDNSHSQVVENVAGVKLPVFTPLNEGGEGELVGMSRGGQRITSCRKTFVYTLELLVRLASLQVIKHLYCRTCFSRSFAF